MKNLKLPHRVLEEEEFNFFTCGIEQRFEATFKILNGSWLEDQPETLEEALGKSRQAEFTFGVLHMLASPLYFATLPLVLIGNLLILNSTSAPPRGHHTPLPTGVLLAAIACFTPTVIVDVCKSFVSLALTIALSPVILCVHGLVNSFASNNNPRASAQQGLFVHNGQDHGSTQPPPPYHSVQQ